MILSVAILDDSKENLKLLERHINAFNLNSRHTIDADFYTDYDKLIREFRHDAAILDINLGSNETNGFKVARYLAKHFEDPVILMLSSDIDESDPLDCMISRYKLKVSEIFQRIFRLKNNHRKNILEVYVRGAEYGRI